MFMRVFFCDRGGVDFRELDYNVKASWSSALTEWLSSLILCKRSWLQQHHRKHPYQLGRSLSTIFLLCDFDGWACS